MASGRGGKGLGGNAAAGNGSGVGAAGSGGRVLQEVEACQEVEAIVRQEHLLICSFSTSHVLTSNVGGWDTTLEPYTIGP